MLKNKGISFSNIDDKNELDKILQTPMWNIEDRINKEKRGLFIFIVFVISVIV